MSRLPLAAAPCAAFAAAPAVARVSIEPAGPPLAYVRAAPRVPRGCGTAAATQLPTLERETVGA